MPRPGLDTADPSLRAAVDALVGGRGMTHASRVLVLDRNTVARIVRGEPVQRGTLALARLGVERLHAPPTSPSTPPPAAPGARAA